MKKKRRLPYKYQTEQQFQEGLRKMTWYQKEYLNRLGQKVITDIVLEERKKK